METKVKHPIRIARQVAACGLLAFAVTAFARPYHQVQPVFDLYSKDCGRVLRNQPALRVGVDEQREINLLLNQILGYQSSFADPFVREMIRSYVALVRSGMALPLDRLPAPGFGLHLQSMITWLAEAEREMLTHDAELKTCLRSMSSSPQCEAKIGFADFIRKTRANLQRVATRTTGAFYLESIALAIDFAKAITLANLWRGGFWNIDYALYFHSAFEPQEYLQNLLSQLHSYGSVAPLFSLQVETRSIGIRQFLATFALPRGLAGTTHQLQTYDGIVQGSADGRSYDIRYETPTIFLNHDLDNHSARHMLNNFSGYFEIDSAKSKMLPTMRFIGAPVQLLNQVLVGLAFGARVEALLRTLPPIPSEAILAVVWYVYHEWVETTARFRPPFSASELGNFIEHHQADLVSKILQKLESPNDLNFDLPHLHALVPSDQQAALERALTTLSALRE